MRSKSFSSILCLCLCLCLLLGGCGEKPRSTDSLLYGKALALVHRVSEMAQSPGYIHALSGDNQEMLLLAESWGEGNYSSPAAVYKVTFSGSIVDMYYESAAAEVPALSGQLRAELEERAFLAMPERINAMNSTAASVLCAVLSADDQFICQELTVNTVFFFLFEDGTPMAVTFLPGDEGIVAASCSFLSSRPLRAVDSEEDTATWLSSSAGLSQCKVSRLTID